MKRLLADPRVGTTLRWTAVAAMAALLWLRRYSLPHNEPSIDLDPSWHRAYTYFFLEGLGAGRDHTFNHGPLAFLEVGPYHPEVFGMRMLVWEGLFKLVLSFVFALAVLRLRGLPERALFFAFLLLVPFSTDAYYFLAVLGLSVLLDDSRRRAAVWLGGAGLAVVSLIKLTYLALALACVVALAVDRAHRTRSLRQGLGTLAPPALTFAILWVATGQTPADLLRWLWAARSLLGGYSDAMGLPVEYGGPGAAAVVIGLAALAFALSALEPCERRPGYGLALVVAAAYFMAFKAGFVRRSSATFFGFAAAACFFFAPGRGGPCPGARLRWGTFAARAACAVVPLFFLDNVRQLRWRTPRVWTRGVVPALTQSLEVLSSLAEWRAEFDRDLSRTTRRYQLPDTRAVVGDAPVDLIGGQQGVLLFNEMNYRPRPVFQGYAAYTPDLMRANARYLEGPRAPEFLLFRPSSIDGRFPTLWDAEALEVMVRDYRPLLAERTFLVLQRAPREQRASRTEPPVLLESEVAFGEWVELGDLEVECQLLAVDVRPTLAGRLNRLIFRAPPVDLEIRDERERTVRFRLVPGMARTGFLLNPLLHDLQTWIPWLTGESPPERVHAFRVLVDPSHSALFRTGVSVRLLDGSDLVPAAAPEAARALRYSMFETRPIEVETRFPLSRRSLGYREVLVVGAPAEMRFDAEGECAVSATFGLTPIAYEEGTTDGVTFSAVAVEGGVERVLFERHLDPCRVQGDRGMQRFEVSTRLAAGGRLVLRTSPGPAGDTRRDLAYWRRVSIEPAP